MNKVNNIYKGMFEGTGGTHGGRTLPCGNGGNIGATGGIDTFTL